jgi:hypothetical protein
LPIFILTGVLDIVCIVHAIKTGRYYPWIMVILGIPVIGSVIYIILEMGPDMMTTRQGHAVKRGLQTVTNPNKDFKARMREVEMVGSADAKRGLAEEYARRGMYTDAIDLYRSSLTGMHKDDPVLLFGLARTQLANGDGAGAQASLDTLQTANPGYVSNDAHMVYARALELQGKHSEALVEYKALTKTFSGEEARCRYALLLRLTGATEQSRDVFREILKLLDGAPRHYRREQKEWGDIARQNLATL